MASQASAVPHAKVARRSRGAAKAGRDRPPISYRRQYARFGFCVLRRLVTVSSAEFGSSDTGRALAHHGSVSGTPKCFVYVLRSVSGSSRTYIGLTSDIAARLKAHNAGQNPSTARHKPWQLVVALEFRSEQAAVRFERYLKSGSGRAFAKRHFS